MLLPDVVAMPLFFRRRQMLTMLFIRRLSLALMPSATRHATRHDMLLTLRSARRTREFTLRHDGALRHGAA